MKYRIVIPALGLFLVLAFFSKPDHGGIKRCFTEVGMDELKDFKLVQEQIWFWRPFETNRYRFKMDKDRFDNLKSRVPAI